MISSRHDFNSVAAEEVVETKKYPPPFSLRLTLEERARLQAEAGDLPLGAYIRERLLTPPRVSHSDINTTNVFKYFFSNAG